MPADLDNAIFRISIPASMKQPIRKVLLIALLACLPSTGLMAKGRGQPRMQDAISLLKAAKDSDNPVPLLHKARASLQSAKHNKGGNRVEALKAVNEAIVLAQSGDKKKMATKINVAIAETHGGMARAR